MAVAALSKRPISPNGRGLATLLPLPRKPHHESCPQLAYLERQGLLYGWNLERWGHMYDLSDRKFWQIFGEKSVPSCACKHRQVASTGHTEVPMLETQPAFVLHYQRNVTAPVLAQLRHRIAMMLATEEHEFTWHYQELETLAPAAGKRAKQVLARLRQFEEHAAQSLRHRRR